MTGVKKTHWLRNTLIVLIICGLAGSALAAVQFLTEKNAICASATIQFTFKGADEGTAPNGYRFDVSGISSDEVLEKALEATELTGTYTADQLRENLNVTGVYPDRIAEQMTKYVSLLDETADSQAAVTDFHATQYRVSLYNGFDNGISSGKLTGLLKEIIAAYRTYFAKTYAPRLEIDEPIRDLQEYDYAQQLEAISGSVGQQGRYARKMAEVAPDFMLDRKGFSDIAVKYQNLKNDVNRLNAAITLNAVSKDKKRLRESYKTEIRTQTILAESLTEELKRIEDQVNAYDKDGIIYVVASNKLQMIGNEENSTYDKLVAKRKEVRDRIADANAVIALYQTRLDDMTGTRTDEEEADAPVEMNESEAEALRLDTEERIEALKAKKKSVVSEFKTMLNAYSAQEINEKTVSATVVKYDAPSLFTGKFIYKAIFTAGPFCAIGFIACMALLVRARRKEEKA